MFPDAAFAGAVAPFQKQFPATLLKFDVESSAVVEPVRDGRCAMGVVGSWSLTPPQLTCEALLRLRIATVVSPHHPLATYRRPIPPTVVAKHIHLVHIDPADVSPAYGIASRSPRVWHLSDRQSTGPGGALVHRSPQTNRRTAVE